MPNFHKEETELETRLDKWLYFIKHLEDFQTIPQSIADEVFKQAFEKAELANLGAVEMDNYEKSLKIFRDLNGAFDTAFGDGKLEGKIEGKLEGKMEGKMEGKLEGKMEGKLEIAKALKNMGVLTATIIASTGLTKEEIEKL
jgi:predicted transposase/invertase (TIGR01784 family)